MSQTPTNALKHRIILYLLWKSLLKSELDLIPQFVQHEIEITYRSRFRN